MFRIEALPPQIDKALLDKLLQAEPATIGHFRHSGFMEPALRAVIPDRRVAGTAVTVQCPGADTTILGYALGQVRAGDVLVVDRCGDARHAGWGGLVEYAAKCAGLAGAIIDGLATDFGEIREYGVPVWCRGPSAITGKRLGLAGEFCTTISCGGVPVRPGDAILADENCILVLDPADIESVADRAIAMQLAEKEKRARLDAGEKLPDISGATEILEKAWTSQNKSGH